MKVTKPQKDIDQAGGAPQSVILQTVEVRPVNRTTQDIPKWRNAVQAAEAKHPRRSLLYDLYADVVQDGHVIAVTGKRLDAVTTANWQFVNKDGKPVDAINELIDSVGFDDLVAEALNSKFWGYSIFEPQFWKNANGRWEVSANLLPRLNYRPNLGVVAYDWATDNGINIREGVYAKTIMEVGKPDDLGLLASAAQYAILKRGGIGDYAMFVQVFGRPIMDATWDGFDEAQRVKLQQSLNIGAGGTIIRPEGTNLTILESKLTQSTIHKDFKDDMNKEISKALLGTTETVEASNSSGYAQAKEHGDQDDNKHESDINFVRRVLNSRFITVLQAHGFNTEGGQFIIQGEETKLSTQESFEMHYKMRKELGLPIDDEFFYETYGVPKPDNYDQIKKQLIVDNGQLTTKKEQDVTSGAVEKQNPKGQNKAKKGPESKEDVKLAMATPEEEEEAVKGINKIVKDFKERLRRLFLTAPAETTGATSTEARMINLAADDFNHEAFIRRAWDAKGKLNIDSEAFNYNAATLLNGFTNGWRTDVIKLALNLGMEYNGDDPALLTAYELNLFRFAGVKNLALAKKLNDHFKNSKSFSEFYRLASQETEIFNKDWLHTEYITAGLAAQSASTYQRLLGKVDTFPYWKYQTMEDEHVRQSHQNLQGVILRWDDPRWKKIFPPGGWNCRCYVSPRMAGEVDQSKIAADQSKVDAYINSPEFAKLAAQGWGVNRGDIGEVFTENQQYIKSMNLAYSELKKLSAADFGLLPLAEAKKAAKQLAPESEAVTNIPETTDYNNRKLQTPKGVNPAVLESLTDPDEVWVLPGTTNTMVYIKYYEDVVWVSLATLDQKQLGLNTWFALKGDAVLQYRKGLLIFSK